MPVCYCCLWLLLENNRVRSCRKPYGHKAQNIYHLAFFWKSFQTLALDSHEIWESSQENLFFSVPMSNQSSYHMDSISKMSLGSLYVSISTATTGSQTTIITSLVFQEGSQEPLLFISCPCHTHACTHTDTQTHFLKQQPEQAFVNTFHANPLLRTTQRTLISYYHQDKNQNPNRGPAVSSPHHLD